MVQRKKSDVILRFLVDRYRRTKPPKPDASQFVVPARLPTTGNRFGWSFFFAVWRRCARSQLHMNSVVLVESQGSCALVRIVRLQKFDRRDNMIFTVHLNRLIDENVQLEQSTIETCLQEACKYQKVTKSSCDIVSRFEVSWLDCVTMMSEMTIAVIVVSASCHHLTRADSGWSRISWFSRVTLPWLRGGTSVAPWRHKCSHVPVFRRLFDRLPVRISTSDLHHRILRKKLYHIRAYDFGVQFSFKLVSPSYTVLHALERSDPWKLKERHMRMRWNTAGIDRENARTQWACMPLILKRNLKLLGGFIGNGDPPPPPPCVRACTHTHTHRLTHHYNIFTHRYDLLVRLWRTAQSRLNLKSVVHQHRLKQYVGHVFS